MILNKRLPNTVSLWALLFLAVVSPRGAEVAPGSPPPDHGSVLIVRDSQATVAFNSQPEIVRTMVDNGVTRFTGKSSLAAAWLSLVSTQDTVGIKVFSSPGALSGTRPSVVSAVVKGLIAAGIPAKQILVWDKRLSDLRTAGYFDLAEKHGIKVAGSMEEGYDDATFYETPLLGRLVWGDHEFGKKGEGVGRKSFVSKLVTAKMTKIISVSPLLNHNLTGVAGNLHGLALGSVDNTLRFELDPARLASAIPEIFALPVLGDRVVLNIVDALVCQYQGEERSLLHYSAALNQLWFSRDPVALDVLSILELDRQRQNAKIGSVKTNKEIYKNAALLEIGISDPRRIRVETVDN